MGKLLDDLKRPKVFKVGAVYAVLAGVLVASAGCNHTGGVRPVGNPPTRSVRLETVVTGAAALNFQNISRDGCLVSYTDWAGGGDLYVREVGECVPNSPDGLARVGKAIRRITNAGSWAESSDFAFNSVLSPDGRSIAWVWWGEGSWTLRAQVIDGGEPRTLHKAGHVKPYHPVWSPDGQQIAMSITAPEGGTQIALIDVEDGGLETLDVGAPLSGMLAYSPDSTHLLLETVTHDARPERDILALSLTDKKVSKLVEHPADDFILGWSPDGSYILFGRARDGLTSAWAQPVAGGNPVGASVQLAADIGASVTRIGFVDSGEFYFSVQAGQSDELFMAALDADGRPTASVQQLGGVAISTAPEFSPDGHDVAFVRQRGARAPLAFAHEVVVRAVESGEERILPPLRLQRLNTDSGVIDKPRWSPDRRHLLFQGVNELGRRGLHTVRTDTGEMKLVHEQSPLVPSWVVDWTPDGQRTVEIQQDYTQGTDGLGLWQIQSRDMNSGTVQKLADYYHVPHIAQALATSPDGRWIAYTGNSGETGPRQRDEGHQISSLLVIPSAGGKVRELYRASPPEYVTGLDWSPDSSRMLFGRSRLETGQERFQLSDVNLEDGKVRDLGLSREDGYLEGLSVHPRGRQIAFTVGALGSREVRVMRGLSGVMVKR